MIEHKYRDKRSVFFYVNRTYYKEIIKYYSTHFVKDVSRYIEISESTLYPILKRLEVSGCVITYTEQHKNRLRKYYRITDKGIESIRCFLEEWEEIQSIYEYIKGEMEDE
ncbi:PadR family transcriptional regulator [Faecalicoccus pleomorphus]|uniref:PadR family transcriptional regulator n=1 Tax=Faecalicoccus pleomorphus TaxID=1323 RepID=A0A380LJB1_9FIRM|nr:PadR family transcriptional regulator [Faecalicoccus pleomorphus]SUO03363.1 PadR family transcriptional regulator [Faecalicoccus pleomorphus]